MTGHPAVVAAPLTRDESSTLFSRTMNLVALTTAMTRAGELVAARSADTDVFYMAGRQLAALSRRLLAAGWTPETPVAVVSRAGWPDQHGSDHRVDTLPEAVVLHGGRPTVVSVGVGALAVAAPPSSLPDTIALPPSAAVSKP